MKRALSALAILASLVVSFVNPASASIAPADAAPDATELACKENLVPCSKSSECCSRCCYTTFTMGSYCTGEPKC